MKAILALLLFILPASLNAQIKIDGPKEGTVGYRSKAKLTVDVDDLQIKCFPANDDWMAVQDFSGNKYIDFVPGKKSLSPSNAPKLFTFVAAGNKMGKTYLETWELLISSDDPTPPLPAPVPDDDVLKSSLFQKLNAAYLVNPAADSLPKLIAVYQSLKTDTDNNKFTTYKEALDELRAMSTAQVGIPLQAVRDVTAEYFVAELGTRGSQWDQKKLSVALAKVISCLKKIKA